MPRESLPTPEELVVRTRFNLPQSKPEEVESILRKELKYEWSVKRQGRTITLVYLFLKLHPQLWRNFIEILNKYPVPPDILKEYPFIDDRIMLAKDKEKLLRITGKALEATAPDAPSVIHIELSPSKEGQIADITYYPILFDQIRKEIVRDVQNFNISSVQLMAKQYTSNIFIGILGGSRSSR